eukprot:TRINITY_DN59856_c0_g1_i1.p1 TRINITY_DN59856_c0_g1~~TRINITY_DN59856_c0_g1_i1.p1  ORF type:complete len:378 (+),score=100.14 TRINITY_DN59856_c0_g1_i1:72-1205(+)
MRKTVGLVSAGLLLGLLQPLSHWAFAGVPQARRLQRPAVGCRATKDGGDDYLINEDIMATEVRVVARVIVDPAIKGDVMEDCNEVMPTKDALAIARGGGFDLILVDKDKDPPLVKIASVGKYIYSEKKRLQAATKNSKQPRVKEVKLGYTVGDHDLNTKLRQIEKWLANPRQQVKIVVVLKGRSKKMFEKQARDLLERIRIDAAAFARVPGTDKGLPAINKDGKGDVFIMLNHGPDRVILKKLIEEAGGTKAMKAAAAKAASEAEDDDEDEDDDADDDDDDEDLADEDNDVAAIEMEIKEMKKELLECGVKPGQLNQQEEMQDLYARLNEAKSKLAGAALRAKPPVVLGPRHATLAFAAGVSSALALALLPHRRRRL